jgi:cytoskeletal protein CcmA (bactofilin family)
MKFITKLSLLLILLAALAFPTAVFAAGVNPTNPADKVVLGGTYELRSGESLDGNLAVFGGTTTIDQNATVNGDVFQAGGTLSIDGRVNGNLSVLGGTIYLNQHAVITGDVSTVGGTLHRDSGAQIQGEVVNGAQGPLSFNTPRPFVPAPVNVNFKPVADALWFFFRTLAIAALALLLGLFVPMPLARVGKAVVDQPVISGGMGLLTAIIAPILLLLLTITIILIPVSLIGILALVVAVTFGWIAIGLELGNRIADLFKSQWPPAIAAAVGTFLVTLVADGIGLIPCIGWLVPAIIGLLGLGAVILTRFGSMVYPTTPFGPVSPAAPVYPPSSPQPPAPQSPSAQPPVYDPGEDNPPSGPAEY